MIQNVNIYIESSLCTIERGEGKVITTTTTMIMMIIIIKRLKIIFFIHSHFTRSFRVTVTDCKTLLRVAQGVSVHTTCGGRRRRRPDDSTDGNR